MPQNKLTGLITDQEIAFARLLLSGTMTDRDAAQSVGLNPDTAADTKARPRVRAWMLEHRAAEQQQLAEQEAGRLHRRNLRREQVLDRLWEIATMSPELTRNSITGQVKALAMIVAIEGLIPDHRATSKQSAPPPTHATIYNAAWLHKQQETTVGLQPDPVLAPEPEEPALARHEPAPGTAEVAPPPPSHASHPSEPAANPVSPRETSSWVPDATGFAPDTRVPFSIKWNPLIRRR